MKQLTKEQQEMTVSVLMADENVQLYLRMLDGQEKLAIAQKLQEKQ